MGKPTMYENYNLLFDRIKDSLAVSDLDEINNKLRSIKGLTITTGSGGSYVVAVFLGKVLNSKNKVPIEVFHPRDFIYKDYHLYKNVIACSYGGSNKGVDLAFDNRLNKFLLSTKKNDNVNSIVYNNTIPKEDSFISIGGSLVPISIILNYYLGNFNIKLEEPKIEGYIDHCYEILTGYDTLTTSIFLESTMVEAGIGIPIIHDKYDYCHGRTTLGYHYDNTVIYLDSGKELDEVIKKELSKYYKNVIILSSESDDIIIRDYELLIKAMFLVKDIASKKGMDLSRVDYSPFVKKLYFFKGGM